MLLFDNQSYAVLIREREKKKKLTNTNRATQRNNNKKHFGFYATVVDVLR